MDTHPLSRTRQWLRAHEGHCLSAVRHTLRKEALRSGLRKDAVRKWVLAMLAVPTGTPKHWKRCAVRMRTLRDCERAPVSSYYKKLESRGRTYTDTRWRCTAWNMRSLFSSEIFLTGKVRPQPLLSNGPSLHPGRAAVNL